MDEDVFEPRLHLAPGEVWERADGLPEPGAVGSGNAQGVSEHRGGLDAAHAAHATRYTVDIRTQCLVDDQARATCDLVGIALHNDAAVGEIDDPFAAFG